MKKYTDEHIKNILTRTRTVAIVGVSLNEERPAYRVAKYLHDNGFNIVPINPGLEGKDLFGKPFYASLDSIPAEVGNIDMIDIFRRSNSVGPIVETAINALSKRGLKTIWMQLGVINEDAEAQAMSAGLDVIMDRCPKIEHTRLIA